MKTPISLYYFNRHNTCCILSAFIIIQKYIKCILIYELSETIIGLVEYEIKVNKSCFI